MYYRIINLKGPETFAEQIDWHKLGDSSLVSLPAAVRLLPGYTHHTVPYAPEPIARSAVYLSGTSHVVFWTSSLW